MPQLAELIDEQDEQNAKLIIAAVFKRFVNPTKKTPFMLKAKT